MGMAAHFASTAGRAVRPVTTYRADGTGIASKNRVEVGMAASKTAQRRPRRAWASDPADRGDASGVDYSALARFRHELRKFQAFSKTAAKTAGLTPQQHQALLAVRGFSNSAPVSVGDLADFLLIRPHTAVELVDRMTRLELFARVVDDTDGRRVLVKLTKEGERRLQGLSQAHLRELRAIGPALARMLETFRDS
jgi:DNA-binding MarR family transcriptional regulator